MSKNVYMLFTKISLIIYNYTYTYNCYIYQSVSNITL